MITGRILIIAVIALMGLWRSSGFDRTQIGEGPNRPQQSPPSSAVEDEGSELDRIRRVTAGACSPGRNAASYLSDIGFFCLPFDAIPAVDDPTFRAASEVSLPGTEPVVAVAATGRKIRAYPVRYLISHEIVNDRVAGEPIVVSFCPLCNSAAAFSRRVGDRVLDFGVSGQLLSSNLVMYDRQTISLWQQVTGRAFAGDHKGEVLDRIPVRMVSFEDFRREHPRRLVMQPPVRGFDYGDDPYAGYGRDADSESRFFRAPAGGPSRTDPRLRPKERVIGVRSGRDAIAFPAPEGAGGSAITEARLGGEKLVAFFRKGVAEPSTAPLLAQGRRGWSGIVYKATLKGKPLSFEPTDRGFRETSTGSVFNLFGRAVAGPLEGAKLEPVDQITVFWFSWADSYPDTGVVHITRPSV